MVSSTVAMAELARARGIVVREYRTESGEHVDCTAGPRDELLVTRYGGLQGLTSVDVHFRGTVVGTEQLIEMEFPDSPLDLEHIERFVFGTCRHLVSRSRRNERRAEAFAGANELHISAGNARVLRHRAMRALQLCVEGSAA
jgi:hypothetical protein